MIEVGQSFGKYRLVERIATGGMAEIFKAAVRGADGHDRIVVIKRLHRSLCDDAELTRMLADEARISVLLDHPNIGQVFDLGSINHQYFIVMAFIDGRDVHDVLAQMRTRREFLPIPAALHVVAETCTALHYAHNLIASDGHPLGIVHRDVSPQNIMVTFDGRVILVDFGIAKARMRAETTQAGVIKGKFYYMAPEQAHGHHVDGRSDVFAAGMVLYEMITAASPYENISDAELLRAVRVANIPPPSTFRRDIDPELEHLIMKAVARDPNLRFQSADEMRYALEEYAHRKFPPVNHREQMAHFIHNLFGGPPQDGIARMDRKQFMSSDDSMIFSKPDLGMLQGMQLPGSVIPADRTEVFDGHSRHLEPNQTSHDLPSNRFPPMGGLPPQPSGGPAPQPDVRPFVSAQTSSASATQSLAARLAQPKIVVPILAFAAVLLVALIVSLMTGDDPESEPEDAVAMETEPAIVVGSAAPAGASVTVPLALNSIPSNATVKIDGESKGSTPIAVQVETGKTYRIEFEKHGYAVFAQDLLVTDDVAPLEVLLVEMDGVLKVASYPSEAVIKINGRDAGIAPMQRAGLTPGTKYLVTATYKGDTQSREVAWEKGESAIIDVLFEFEKAPAPVVETVVVNQVAAQPSRTPTRTTTRTTPKAEGKSLSVWGADKKAPEKKEEKEEDDDDDDDDALSVWGSKKKESKPKRKPEPEAEEPAKKAEKLSIW
jgi:serine/threonine protein kinase